MKTPTCYKNSERPTLIDVVMTNVPKKFKDVMICVDTELSNVHNMVCFSKEYRVLLSTGPI